MSDIYVSGTIDNDLARYFSYEMQWADDTVTVHINSNGGDVFAAIAMAHAIRHSDKVITISVEGFCASAAVLLLCCGRRVVSAFNSLFMIHGVSAILEDSYNVAELEKVKTSLEKVEETISKTLQTRLKEVDLSKEQWLTADEALTLGLIDEITPAQADIKIDNKRRLMFVNGHLFKIKNTMPEVNVMDVEKIRNQIRNEETGRIRALQKLKCGNAAVNAIIDVAISKGHGVTDVKAYIDAVNNASPFNNSTANWSWLVHDQQNSGADKIPGGEATPDFKAEQMNRVIDAANRGFK